MQNSSTEETRNVIPRWRSPVVMEGWELSSAQTHADVRPIRPEDYTDRLERWRKRGGAEAGNDIFAAGVALSDKRMIWEGGMMLLADSDNLEPRLIEAVQREITAQPDIWSVRTRRSILEQNDSYVRATIRMLKMRFSLYPRNPILALELSRHYCILGQYGKAERWLMISLSLAPENRVILRAAVQFYDVVGDLAASLPFLWRADGLKYDPLIQSAEVAATEISGKQSRTAATLRRQLKGVKAVNRIRSEAALALATLEHNSGLPERTVFKLVSAGLADPTENALAQAIWVGDQSQRTIKERLPDLNVDESAYEARAYLLFEKRNYELALSAGFMWSADQPFQAHPLAFICTCSAFYASDPYKGLAAADRIIQRHAMDFSAVNAALLTYSSCRIQAKAKAALAILARLAGSRVEDIFVDAGRGLVSYAEGDLSAAQTHYTTAIRAAGSMKRVDLAFRAAAFYILGETVNGSPSKVELEKSIVSLEKVLRRVPVEGRLDADQLWDKVKEIARGQYEDDGRRKTDPSRTNEGRLLYIADTIAEST